MLHNLSHLSNVSARWLNPPLQMSVFFFFQSSFEAGFLLDGSQPLDSACMFPVEVFLISIL